MGEGERPLSRRLIGTAVIRVWPFSYFHPHTYSTPGPNLHTSSLQDVTDLSLKMVQLVQARLCV